MGLKIQRVDLKKDGKGVTLKFEQSAVGRDGGGIVDSDNNITIHKKPHDDLANCFIKMVPHLMFLSELAKPEVLRPEWFDDFKFLDDERFVGVNVTGIIVSGKDRDILRIIGTKTTSKKEAVSIIAPQVWMEEEGEAKYVLADVLRTTFSKLMDEVDKFYVKGKYAPEDQLELEMS